MNALEMLTFTNAKAPIHTHWSKCFEDSARVILKLNYLRIFWLPIKLVRQLMHFSRKWASIFPLTSIFLACCIQMNFYAIIAVNYKQLRSEMSFSIHTSNQHSIDRVIRIEAQTNQKAVQIITIITPLPQRQSS